LLHDEKNDRFLNGRGGVQEIEPCLVVSELQLTSVRDVFQHLTSNRQVVSGAALRWPCRVSLVPDFRNAVVDHLLGNVLMISRSDSGCVFG